jgi:hypothetical protein
MKSIEELALGTADVAAITPKVIADTIEEVARGAVVFAQFFKVNRDLIGQGKPREISFPKKSTGISVTWGVAPGSTVSPSSFTYDAVTVSVQKIGMRLEFTNEALEQAMRDVIKDHIYEAGLEYGEAVDDQGQTIMLDLKRETVSISGGSVGTASNIPIIRIISVSDGTIANVEYDTGQITLTGSVATATVVTEYSGYLQSTGLWVGATNAGTLSARDILRAKGKLAGQHRNPDAIILNPVDMWTLFFSTDAKLVDASVYGSNEPLLNGEIGKLFGMKVVLTSRAPEGVAILVDSARLGYDVRRRELNGVREDKPEYDAVWYHFWAERNFGVADSLAVAAVVNAASSDSEYPAA